MSELLGEEEKREYNKALAAAAKEVDLDPSVWKVTSDKRTVKMPMIDPSDWNLGNIPDPEVLDDGEEVQVTITSVVEAKTKSGDIPYWRVTLEVPDRPLVKDFSYNLYQPFEGQTPKQDFNAKYNIQTFMKAFSLNMGRAFSPEEDWVGEKAWCIVNMREDKEYGRQNSVRKWIIRK